MIRGLTMEQKVGSGTSEAPKAIISTAELDKIIPVVQPKVDPPSLPSASQTVAQASSLPGPPMKRVRPIRNKKPKDMPSRPLSAYNMFFREERVRWLQERQIDPSAPVEMDASVPSLGEAVPEEIQEEADEKEDAEGDEGSKTAKKQKLFHVMGKTIGQRWRTLTAEERAKYTQLADQDMQRYRKEMEAYNDKQIRESALGAAALRRANEVAAQQLQQQQHESNHLLSFQPPPQPNANLLGQASSSLAYGNNPPFPLSSSSMSSFPALNSSSCSSAPDFHQNMGSLIQSFQHRVTGAGQGLLSSPDAYSSSAHGRASSGEIPASDMGFPASWLRPPELGRASSLTLGTGDRGESASSSAPDSRLPGSLADARLLNMLDDQTRQSLLLNSRLAYLGGGQHQQHHHSPQQNPPNFAGLGSHQPPGANAAGYYGSVLGVSQASGRSLSSAESLDVGAGGGGPDVHRALLASMGLSAGGFEDRLAGGPLAFSAGPSYGSSNASEAVSSAAGLRRDMRPSGSNFLGGGSMVPGSSSFLQQLQQQHQAQEFERVRAGGDVRGTNSSLLYEQGDARLDFPSSAFASAAAASRQQIRASSLGGLASANRRYGYPGLQVQQHEQPGLQGQPQQGQNTPAMPQQQGVDAAVLQLQLLQRLHGTTNESLGRGRPEESKTAMSGTAALEPKAESRPPHPRRESDTGGSTPAEPGENKKK